jgi:hypothetical protein
MPGRPCKICHSVHRADVDAALLEGESQVSIGQRFGFRQAAISRHFLAHLRPHVARAAAVTGSMSIAPQRTRLPEHTLTGAMAPPVRTTPGKPPKGARPAAPSEPSISHGPVVAQALAQASGAATVQALPVLATLADITGRLNEIAADLKATRSEARVEGAAGIVVSASREERAAVESLARLFGLIQDQPQVAVQVNAASGEAQVAQRVLASLAGDADVRARVAAALLGSTAPGADRD